MSPTRAAPTILQLTIERFRGISNLEWEPASGMNVILGGGDVGKSTILDAIGLLFAPTNAGMVPDTDYFGRKEEDEFSIEAVIALPHGGGINHLTKPAWPWLWTGKEAIVPMHDDAGGGEGEEVYKVRVTGTRDLELTYEVIQPSGAGDAFPVSFRRSIGLVRLGGDDRNDRDLRLVQGSALDRLLSDKGLRSRVANELADSNVSGHLSEEARKALNGLDTAFRERKLPVGLDIAVAGGQGPSVGSLIGLTAQKGEVRLPVSSWGAGTRRLSSLAIAEQQQAGNPITLVDEVERGLEPYRQRELVEKLQLGSSQSFITTHSPAAIAAASSAMLWYVDHTGTIGKLDGKKISALRAHDPEAFLARMTIVAEGVTEVGFATSLLERVLGCTVKSLGLHIADGRGHDETIEILEALSAGRMCFGGFADNEGRHPNRWSALQKKLGPMLFRWKSQDLEENVIKSVSDENLEALIQDPSGFRTGARLRSLADRLFIADKSFASIKSVAGENLRQLILDAAHGTPGTDEKRKKEFQSHAQTWFKTRRGGKELEEKVFSLAVWNQLKSELLPFCNAIREAVGLAPIDDLQYE